MVRVSLHRFNQPRRLIFEKSDCPLTSSKIIPADSYSPGNGGQDAINGANWYVDFLLVLVTLLILIIRCDGQPTVKVSYDKAGVSGLVVSNVL